MQGHECPEAVLPDRALYFPTCIHLLIVNKLLSLSRWRKPSPPTGVFPALSPPWPLPSSEVSKGHSPRGGDEVKSNDFDISDVAPKFASFYPKPRASRSSPYPPPQHVAPVRLFLDGRSRAVHSLSFLAASGTLALASTTAGSPRHGSTRPVAIPACNQMLCSTDAPICEVACAQLRMAPTLS
jgi:hypothetical protein